MSGRQITLAMVLFLIAFLIGALINIPAIQLFHFIQLPQNVAIEGLQGSLTNGKISRVEVQGYPMSDLAFKLQPECLIKLSICYQISSDEDGILLNLERSLLGQSMQISDSYIEIPDSIFTKIPNLLVKPTGDFSVQIGALRIDQAQKLEVLSAQVKWNKAGVAGEKQVIGNYTANITTSHDGLDVQLSDRESLLGVQGNVAMNWQGQFETDLELEHKAGLNPSLISVLEMSAQKSGLNQFRIKKKGVLPANILRQIGRFLPNNGR